MLGNCALNGFAVEHSEDFDIFLSILVRHIEPELVELVRAGTLGVKPDIALLGLSEFATVSLGDERAGEGISLASAGTADKFGTGGDVAPLVCSSELQLHAFVLIEVEKLIALKQLVGKFCEGHSFGRIT